MGRPPIPLHEIPPRHRWQAVPDPDFRLIPEGMSRRCRHTHAGVRCPSEAQALLSRPIYWHRQPGKRREWAYCEAHLYGRWIEDELVLRWRLVAD